VEVPAPHRSGSNEPEAVPAVASVVCVSCGAPLTGRYCAQCGERRLAPGDHKLRSYTAGLAEELASTDSRLLRTLATLLLRPGKLTLEYMRGRRIQYLSPIRVFLLGNVVYFFVHPFTGYSGYNTPLRSQMEAQFYSRWLDIPALVQARVQQLNVPFGVYEEAFNARSSLLARTLVILVVPMLACVLALLFRHKRRPSVEHVVFATHYYAFELLFLASLFLLFYSRFLFPSIARGLAALGESQVFIVATLSGFLATLLTEFVTALPSAAYLYLATRIVYDTSRLATAGCTLIMIAALFGAILVFRVILFYATLLTVG
jgi:hypothetical protein